MRMLPSESRSRMFWAAHTEATPPPTSRYLTDCSMVHSFTIQCRLSGLVHPSLPRKGQGVRSFPNVVESLPSAESGDFGKLLLDAEKLVILHDAVGAVRRAGFDLAGIRGDG